MRRTPAAPEMRARARGIARRRPRRAPAAILVALVLASALAAPVSDAKPTSKKLPTRKQRAASTMPPVLNRNLIANGDGEIASEPFAAGWLPAELVESEVYGRTAGEWDWDLEGAPGGGKRYMRLRVPANQERVEAAQTISVAREADAIDQGRLEYALGGWLGGVVDGPGAAELAISFTDERRQPLGAITTELRSGRDLPAPTVGRASLAEQRLTGLVPAGTRRIHVWLRGVNARFAGCPECDATALADNLSLVLTRRLERP
jgi:hypothetical protein